MLIRSLCLASLLAPLAQADTITVGPDPAVYDYTTIQPAVLFSAPGDTILIAPGEYAGFDVNNRSLQIIGAGPGRTRITELATMFSSGTSIRVHNQDQGRTRLGGFSIESPVDAGKWSGFPWLAVQNCSVPIELFDIEFEAPVATHWDTAFWTDDAFPSPRSGYVYASDCQQVFLSNVQINGAAERDFSELVMVGTSGGDTVGTAGLSAARSQIYAANCRFEGTRLTPARLACSPGRRFSPAPESGCTTRS
ncbi:MAG: hypothetical protein ACYS26_00910 [Planctomycetota bacterium]|jgi:hypothetical protein